MSNVIQFLEAAGRGVALASIDYEAAVASLEIEDAQRDALLSRDPASLGRLLDGRVQMMCMISTPQKEQEESLPDEEETFIPDEEESDLPQ